MSSSFVKQYHDVFSDDFCDTLIGLHRRLDQEGLSGVTHRGKTVRDWQPIFKHAIGVQVEDGPTSLFQEVNRRLEVLRTRYFQDIGMVRDSLLPFKTIRAQVQRYPQAEGFYQQHVDVSPKTLSRCVSFVAYLNDVEEGGETVFPVQKTTIQPKKGSVVVFPPYWMFPHKAEKPISGDKYILITIHEFEVNHVGN